MNESLTGMKEMFASPTIRYLKHMVIDKMFVLLPKHRIDSNVWLLGKLIQKTSEVLSLLRPIVHDTSKTAKITWFIIVLHWAVDVIEVLY